MAGTIIPILSMQEFDFSFLAASTSKTIVIDPAVNVVRWYRANLLVRVHQIDMPGSGESISVYIYGTNPSRDDPQEFTLASYTFWARVLGGAYNAGDMLFDSATNIYPFFKVVVQGTQSGSGGARLFAVLSADLIVYDK